MPRQREASLPLPAAACSASALIEGRDWDLAVQAATELSGGNRERRHCLVDGGPLSKRGWQGECGWWLVEEALQFENGGHTG